MASKSKISKSKISKLRLFLILAFTSGIIIFSFGLYSKYRSSALSFNKLPTEEKLNTEKGSVPIYLEIEKANISISVKPAKIIDGVWQVYEDSVSFLETSSSPGEGGNIVIYGHNKKEIFGNLTGYNLLDETIKIITEDKKEHIYKIEDIKTVTPSEIEIVMPSDHEVLTLYTCTGFLDSKRLVIKAYPISVN